MKEREYDVECEKEKNNGVENEDVIETIVHGLS